MEQVGQVGRVLEAATTAHRAACKDLAEFESRYAVLVRETSDQIASSTKGPMRAAVVRAKAQHVVNRRAWALEEKVRSTRTALEAALAEWQRLEPMLASELSKARPTPARSVGSRRWRSADRPSPLRGLPNVGSKPLDAPVQRPGTCLHGLAPGTCAYCHRR